MFDSIVLQAIQRLYPRTWQTRRLEYFEYEFVWNTLAASAASAQQQVTINADSDFLLTHLTRTCTNAAGTTFSSSVPVTVLLQDSAGNQFTSGAVHIDNLAGTAQLPAKLPWVRLIRGNATVTAQATNADAANAYLLRLAMCGVRVYGPGTAQISATA